MNAQFLLSLTDRLNDYLSRFHHHFGRHEQLSHLALYCRGRLGPLERKSLEPIALAEGVSPRPLQLFLDKRKWDHEGVLDTFHGIIAEELGSPDGIFIIDETSDAKKGDKTCGIARQYCGESGKIDNCIVSVHLAYTGKSEYHVLIDGDLFLPASWDAGASDEADALRTRTGVPENVGHRTRQDMSITQLEHAIANGIAGRWVTADEAYGRSWQWREQVEELGLCYVVEVPRNLKGWTSPPRFKPPRKTGKPGRPSVRKKALQEAVSIETIPPAKSENWRVREGTKGPDIWSVYRCPLYISSELRRGQAQKVILLICDNPLTGERKWFVSNAPENTATRELLRVAFSRWRVERCFQDAKGELGLNHAETRSWISIRRHFILTCVLHLFLTQVCEEWGKKGGLYTVIEPVG